jgi:hypothetical protein
LSRGAEDFGLESYSGAARLRLGVVEAVAKIKAAGVLGHENQVLCAGKVGRGPGNSKLFFGHYYEQTFGSRPEMPEIPHLTSLLLPKNFLCRLSLPLCGFVCY